MNSGRRFASLLLLPLVLPLVLASISIPNHQIAPGVSIPTISIGTWTEGTSSNSTLIVTNWLGLGARGIDAAYIYFVSLTCFVSSPAQSEPVGDYQSGVRAGPVLSTLLF